MHKVDYTLVSKNMQAARDGRGFQKRIKEYVYKQQMEIAEAKV